MPTQATNCPHCQEEDYAFTRVLAWGGYQSVLRSIILRIKDQLHEALAHHAGTLLADQFRDKLKSLPIDGIVPVPLHWTRRMWRGYNQAAVLANAVARVLHKPCHHAWLRRRRPTPHQASVTPLQRRKNLRQAMVASILPRFQGQHLLLIDDVMTTGSTADACARALINSGASSVYLLVLARAVGESAPDPTTLSP